MKKRLIFTLLYESGSFVLSRNFRTQKIGDIRWLDTHYNFEKVARHIDELVVINISRNPTFDDHFRETLSDLVGGVFVPVTAGGGIKNMEDARALFSSGADKILVNRALHHDPSLVTAMARVFGQQAIVGSIDVRREPEKFVVYSDKGSRAENTEACRRLIDAGHIGEVYLNSIDQDGTGQGLDLGIVDAIGPESAVPIILAGGAGKPAHLVEALSSPRVSAVATANLLNFVGDGLRKTREAIRSAGIDVASWD